MRQEVNLAMEMEMEMVVTKLGKLLTLAIKLKAQSCALSTLRYKVDERI